MLPLVSVTICTRNRRKMLERALNCYYRQTWLNRELIVVESGDEDNYDLVQGIGVYRYVRTGDSLNLASKRNVAARYANGEFICHFDDDDWSGSERIEHQMAHFTPEVELVGYDHTFWWDELRDTASLYKGAMWGATLLYRREYIERHPFDERINLAEDSPFIADASRVSIPAGKHMVCTMHGGNVVRTYDPDFWPMIPFTDLPSEFRRVV